MATFIGSSTDGKYSSEDDVIKILEKCFDNTCRIYRNRPTVIGTEYDVCLLCPYIGIFLFEVKAWKPENILKVRNNSVYIKDDDKPHNPAKQAKDYCIALTDEIEDRLGVAPFIHPFVWLTNFSENDLKETGLNFICKRKDTFLAEEFNFRESFKSKMNDRWDQLRASADNWASFTPEMMELVEEKIYGDYEREDQSAYREIHTVHEHEISENEILDRLKEYFGDSCQVCQYWPEGSYTKHDFYAYVVHPDKGIFLFEVKTWQPEDISEVRNGDSIIVRGITDPQNPIKQARSHGFALTDKIKNELGEAPFIQPFVWLINFTKDNLIKTGIDPICKYEVTFLKEDFESRESFVTKFNKCYARMERKANYTAEENPPEMMSQAVNIIEGAVGSDKQAVDEAGDKREKCVEPEAEIEKTGKSGKDTSFNEG